MTRQTINIGASANDRTGDSLRIGGDKVNDNFIELYNYIGGDSDQLPANRVVLHRNILIDSDQSLPSSYDYYILNKGSSLAISLSDGVYTGERKSFTNRGAGTATITPVSFGPGSSIALPQNAGCEMLWDSASWYLISSYNATVS